MGDLTPNLNHFFINIILSTSGSSGDKIIFQYPCDANKNYMHSHNVNIMELHKDLLSTILYIKSESCNKPFLIKVDGVYFAGFPGLLYHDEYKIKLFNITFVYKGNLWKYQFLSKLLAIAFKAEQSISGYMTLMINLMSKILEEIPMEKEKYQNAFPHNPYDQMLHRNIPICVILAELYNNLINNHNVNVMINENTFFAFILEKNYLMDENKTKLKPKSCKRLGDIKAYHTLLFIKDKNCINHWPLNLSRVIQKLFKVYCPTKSFSQMAKELSISLYHIITVAQQLIIWNYGIIMYPICENNIYVISPFAHKSLNLKMLTKFTTTFGHLIPNLLNILMQFHFPFDLKYHFHPLSNSLFNCIKHKDIKLKIICWLIKHQLIIQLHNYVYLVDSKYDIKLGIISSEDAGNSEAKDFNIKKFNQLIPYLNGKHHIEEIMFINKLHRSALIYWLEKHKNSLILVAHQDPITIRPEYESFG